ncbi:glucose-fructose oxidoreductase [Haloferax sp. Atlit-4N]|uniref:D-xylose 1-dehydrogenase Gfo6 n=1 Tax=unclassified Haloferax TaxID=2625095 RepID=UPI000E23D732|nr:MULTISPECIES: D-xylose 1-dehydrogenase Gfo6 [unclassified Haloferax]RDZ39496.1 glucose-fructose oxidoreductase [Haloferax sp. Atlit-19N]RDZ50228.1 glucose-fructose oxidoreductase [Haloferax sp. Atlit-4N]
MTFESMLEDFERRDWETGVSGTLRFAVIGIGWWTLEQAIPAIEESDNCETTVAVSSSTEKAERVVSQFETISRGLTYDEFHDGDAAAAYDAVYICSPNALHLPYAKTAARLGKAVLCEKPMEANVERAAEMRDVCSDADVPLMIGYRMQVEPAIRQSRELIRNGAIGDPVLGLGNNSQSILELTDDPNQWRLNPELAGRGASVTDIGIYPLNTARFLLDADPVAAQAFMHSPDGPFDEVPDEHTAFTLSFDDGSYISCTASQSAHAATSLRIIGTEGELYIEPAFHLETKVRLTRGTDIIEISPPQVNQMTELFDYFADCVLSGRDIGPDGQHGVLDMRAIEAVYDAAASKRTTLIK